jgi:hypothetical protein
MSFEDLVADEKLSNKRRYTTTKLTLRVKPSCNKITDLDLGKGKA